MADIRVCEHGNTEQCKECNALYPPPPNYRTRLLRRIRDSIKALDEPHVGRPGDLYTQAITLAVKRIERIAEEENIKL